MSSLERNVIFFSYVFILYSLILSFISIYLFYEYFIKYPTRIILHTRTKKFTKVLLPFCVIVMLIERPFFVICHILAYSKWKKKNKKKLRTWKILRYTFFFKKQYIPTDVWLQILITDLTLRPICIILALQMYKILIKFLYKIQKILKYAHHAQKKQKSDVHEIMKKTKKYFGL